MVALVITFWGGHSGYCQEVVWRHFSVCPAYLPSVRILLRPPEKSNGDFTHLCHLRRSTMYIVRLGYRRLRCLWRIRAWVWGDNSPHSLDNRFGGPVLRQEIPTCIFRNPVLG